MLNLFQMHVSTAMDRIARIASVFHPYAAIPAIAHDIGLYGIVYDS